MRDWYVESFKDLREFPPIKDINDEKKFTDLLRHIYHRHRHVVPVMAMGVAELKRELQEGVGLLELPEIHQFLDGFYLSRIGIRILIGQHIALHEPEQEDYIGKTPFWPSCCLCFTKKPCVHEVLLVKLHCFLHTSLLCCCISGQHHHS